jgi:diguanylate cyclase (GGDEF)-like protein
VQAKRSSDEVRPALSLIDRLSKLRIGALSEPRSATPHPFEQAHRMLTDFEATRKAWFWEVDGEGHIVYLTPQLAEALGLDDSALADTHFTSLILHDAAAAADNGASERTLAFHLTAHTGFIDIAVRSARQDEVWWSLTGTPVFADDGRFAGFRGSGTDLTEARRADAEIARLAHYDTLTGLPNRLLMRRLLTDMLSPQNRRGGDCALFMLDLDRFKAVNDSLGHPVGDVLLEQVAQRLERALGTKGRTCRLGGDEFTVLIANVRDRTKLAELADSLIARLSFPYTIAGSTISIGASIGIAISPFDGDESDDLIRNADLALYAAKEEGRGVHCFYKPQMHAEAKDRRLIEIDLRQALATDQLEMRYQPVIDVATGALAGFEALLRWEHPTRGAIPPGVFVPMAEEIGMIAPIGDWVVRTAIAAAAQWPEHLRLAVNISPLQFANVALPVTVMNALAASGMAPQRLELELTEGVFLTESAATDGVFHALKAMGVRLALDDFGVGYASLANLKRLPFDTVKIDQSFVRGIAESETPDVRFLSAIVALADSLDMITVAEGAETVGEVELIRAVGCSLVQGYIFGKALKHTDTQALIARETAAVAASPAERAPRFALFRKGRLYSEGRDHPVRIRNVSAGGAMVEIDANARIGNVVDIDLGTDERFGGHVRWTRDRCLGVAFDEPLDTAKIVRKQRSDAKPDAAV